jgi:hypothetical protein
VKKSLVQPTFTQTQSNRQEKVIRAILAYCVEHPDAKDTVEGILTWWFPVAEVSWSMEEVRTALEFLTTRGWITSRTIRKSEQIYGVSKERLPEIKDFLNGLGTVTK